MKKMLSTLKNLFAAWIAGLRRKDDRVMFITLPFLGLLAIGFLVRDICMIAAGTVGKNGHIPFVAAIGLGAIVAIVSYTWHLMETGGRGFEKDGMPKDSFLHPDNLPKDRADDGRIE